MEAEHALWRPGSAAAREQHGRVFRRRHVGRGAAGRPRSRVEIVQSPAFGADAMPLALLSEEREQQAEQRRQVSLMFVTMTRRTAVRAWTAFTRG